MQKIGYYYDHRMCRNMLSTILDSYNQKLQYGLDLFCYVGSWGLTMLKGPVQEVEFVDQGDFEESVTRNVAKNKINKKIKFTRKDVFKFLESAEKNHYDIIVCDPPAFSKSRQTQDNALFGYKKIYKMILPLLKENSFLVVASCTKNVTWEDLDQIINNESKKLLLKPMLLDIGMQGFDHKTKSMKDKANYIKCLIYYFEK
jgi:23S rRNA (cytosine1962-C5)-methyltransferase